MNSENKLPKSNRGRLRNGNPSGDFMKAPRCGARNRQGQPCRCPVMRGKRRCRLHGGKSTGARTKEGIHRIRCANWKDGSRSARLQREAKPEAKRQEEEMRAIFLRDLDEGTLMARGILGFPLMPRIKVRNRAIANQPPAEWKNRMNEKLQETPNASLAKQPAFGRVWNPTISDPDSARTLEELRRLVDSDISRFFDARGNLKPLDQVALEDRATIASIEVVWKNTAAGDGKMERVLKIRLKDKMRALKMAMKHFGLLPPRSRKS